MEILIETVHEEKNSLNVYDATFSQKGNLNSHIESQTLHDLNDFFPSWTVSICSFRNFLLVKLASQVCITFERLLPFMNWFNMHFQISFLRNAVVTNGFFPSWTDSIYLTGLIKYFFGKKLHLNGFFPLWTDSVCLLKYLFWEKAL